MSSVKDIIQAFSIPLEVAFFILRDLKSNSVHFKLLGASVYARRLVWLGLFIVANCWRSHRRWQPQLRCAVVAVAVTALAARPCEQITERGPPKRRRRKGRRMTAARRPDEFAGPCRVNTLPPLYPHCMRHQQHR